MPLISATDIDARLEALYELVAEDEDARTCRDLDDDACRWVPRNFFVYLASNTLTKLGDALANPKTVLAWVMAAVGAPTAMVAMLVPLRESGSLLPQLALGARGAPPPPAQARSGCWAAGLQAAAILGCAVAAALLTGVAAGAVILACVAVFALARSLNSIASKDLVGKTIPKGRRGRLGRLCRRYIGSADPGAWACGSPPASRARTIPVFYAALLAGAALTWLLAMAVFSTLQEQPGETAGGQQRLAGGPRTPGPAGARPRLPPLRHHPLAAAVLGADGALLRGAGPGPRQRRRLAAGHLPGGRRSGLQPVGAGVGDHGRPLQPQGDDRRRPADGGPGHRRVRLMRLRPGLAAASWLFPAFFFALGVAHAGVRAGRKTYLVDLAGGVKRTDYVAVSNTVIGGVLLAVGGLTSAFSFLAPEALILGLSLLGLGGAALAATLPEVE